MCRETHRVASQQHTLTTETRDSTVQRNQRTLPSTHENRRQFRVAKHWHKQHMRWLRREEGVRNSLTLRINSLHSPDNKLIQSPNTVSEATEPRSKSATMTTPPIVSTMPKSFDHRKTARPRATPSKRVKRPELDAMIVADDTEVRARLQLNVTLARNHNGAKSSANLATSFVVIGCLWV